MEESALPLKHISPVELITTERTGALRGKPHHISVLELFTGPILILWTYMNYLFNLAFLAMHYVTGSREEELMSVFGNLQNHPLHHNKTAD